MAKDNEFAWSSQQQLGMVEVSEKERRLISLCSLDVESDDMETETRWYISFSTLKFFKKKDEKEPTWRPVKGYTIPLDNWLDVRNMIEENIEWE